MIIMTIIIIMFQVIILFITYKEFPPIFLWFCWVNQKWHLFSSIANWSKKLNIIWKEKNNTCFHIKFYLIFVHALKKKKKISQGGGAIGLDLKI